MNTEKLTNPTVRAAIEALQKGTGHFHSDQWGDFPTYFRFRLNAAGKIERLDIGQA